MVRLPALSALSVLPVAAGMAFAQRHRLRALSLRLVVKPVAHGLEHVSDQPGPFIFVANHPSALDAPLIRDAIAHHFPHSVAVSAAPPSAARLAVERLFGLRSIKGLNGLLRQGISVVLFPERNPSDDGTMTEFDLGAARLAIRTGFPVVPVALHGTFAALPPWRVLPVAGRPQVTVLFGRPIYAEPTEEPHQVTDRILQSVAVGLAEETQGWYGALRAHAKKTLIQPGVHAASAARWRRIWKATSAPQNRSHRKVWI